MVEIKRFWETKTVLLCEKNRRQKRMNVTVDANKNTWLKLLFILKLLYNPGRYHLWHSISPNVVYSLCQDLKGSLSFTSKMGDNISTRLPGCSTCVHPTCSRVKQLFTCLVKERLSRINTLIHLASLRDIYCKIYFVYFITKMFALYCLRWTED